VASVSLWLCFLSMSVRPLVVRAGAVDGPRGVRAEFPRRSGCAHDAFDLRAAAAPRCHVEAHDLQIDGRRGWRGRWRRRGCASGGRATGRTGAAARSAACTTASAASSGRRSRRRGNHHACQNPRTLRCPFTFDAADHGLHLRRGRLALCNHNRRGRADEGDPAEHCKLHRFLLLPLVHSTITRLVSRADTSPTSLAGASIGVETLDQPAPKNNRCGGAIVARRWRFWRG
jgi:hypothetical protein